MSGSHTYDLSRSARKVDANFLTCSELASNSHQIGASLLVGLQKGQHVRNDRIGLFLNGEVTRSDEMQLSLGQIP